MAMERPAAGRRRAERPARAVSALGRPTQRPTIRRATAALETRFELENLHASSSYLSLRVANCDNLALTVFNMLVFEAHGTITAGSARRRRLYRAKRRFPRLSFASPTFCLCVSLVPVRATQQPSREEDSSSCCWWIESFFRNRSTNPLSSPWNFSSLSEQRFPSDQLILLKVA